MTSRPAPSAETLARLTAAVGDKYAIRDRARMDAYLTEWRGTWEGKTPLLLRPGSTAEVSALLRICAETNTAVVPQGGNTGLVGGQIPNGGEVLISLQRLNRVRALDVETNSITVEGGCILSDVQEMADQAERFYPLSLASEGSARIGGLLSTNAGGVNVLRYGTAREHVLGLEVVLADGRIWDGLKALRKDNTGYDLKSLFLGSEGTLGIITAAVLKLWPKPQSRETAFAAVDSPKQAVAILQHVQAATGGLVSSFELIPRIGVDFILSHYADARDPLSAPAPWYVLLEVSAGRASGLRDLLEETMADALGSGLLRDAAFADSEAQRAQFWALRENLSEVQKFEGGSLKHDISVPVSSIADFIINAVAAVENVCPGIRPVPFGHIGDGNIHFSLSQPKHLAREEYLALKNTIAKIVFDLVLKYGGSISAEHGIGIALAGELERVKPAIDLDLMRALKKTLDPQGILNPGKVLRN